MTENTPNMENLCINAELFKNVKCFVSGNLDPKIEKILASNGAQFTKFMVGSFTHVICGKNFDETHVAEALDLYSVPSVNEEWVLASARIGRLAVIKPYAPVISTAPSPLFSKFVFSMSQLDASDRKNLYGLITFHGGKVQKMFTNKTTHLICGAAAGVAYTKALEMGRIKTTIITPDWITESVKNKTLLNPETFHPRLLLGSTTTNSVAQMKPMKIQPTITMQSNNESLANILGHDFEESIAKTEVPITREPPTTIAAIQTTITQTTVPAISEQTQPTAPMQQQQQQQVTIQPQQNQQQQQQNVFIQQQQMRQQMNPGIQQQLTQQQQINQIMQQQQQQQQNQVKAPNMYTVVTKNAAEDSITLNSQDQIQVSQVVAPEQSQPQHQPQPQPPTQMTYGNTIIRQQTPQQIQQQGVRMQTQPIGGGGVGGAGGQQGMNQQQFMQQMQHVHQTRQPQPQMQVQGQQKQQILLNQSFNIQQTRIITSIPSNGQQIITQQINPQQMQQIQQVSQQKIVQGQMALNPQQQQQQQQGLPPGMPQNQIRPGMPGQIQHRPQGGTMIIQNQQQVGMQNQQQQQLIQGQHNIVQGGQQQQQHIIQSQQIIQGNPMNQQVGGQQVQIQSQQIVQGGLQNNQQQQVLPGPGQQIIQNQQIIQQGQQILNSPQTPGVGPGPGPPQQFVRAARPQFQRHLIQLDAQTHAQLQKMDPQKRQEYLQQLQAKRMMIRPQGAPGATYQGPGVGQPGIGVGDGNVGPRPGTQHILIRGQVPQGLTQQQQMAWLQQQAQTRPLLVRQASHTPGLSPITQQQQQQGGPQQQQQFQVDPNATPQQQHQQIQLQIQRQQQFQRLQMQRESAAKTPGTPVSPRGAPGFPGPPDQTDHQQQIIIQDPTNKTKTALANMLSSRLGNNGGGVNPSIIQDAVVPEPSAAGTLRLMTAQHNASLNQNVPPPRTPQELMALQQQQQQQQQQRRSLGNITNAPNVQVPPNVPPNMGQPGVAIVGVGGGAMPVVGPPGGGGVGVVGPQGVIPQSPNRVFSPNRVAIPPRPQFYGHNPNLKLPPELFLIGCHFHIVEYDETNPNELADWKTLILKHGGEIEPSYSVRVTHVLCRTQRHGVVMQAIRDSKRCITAYWLSDVMLKKALQPPWQALHLPFPHTFGTQKPATKHIISIMGFEGEERERIKAMVRESGAHLTSYFARQNTLLIAKKIDTMNPKYKKAKEWNIPIVNAAWLSDILIGNLSTMSAYETQKYQTFNQSSPFRIEYQLLAHLMNPWKAPINLTQEFNERVKRELSNPSPVPTKRPRTFPFLEQIPKEIVCTKYPEPDKVPNIVFSRVDDKEGLTRAVKILGGNIVEDPSTMTILAVTRLARTTKLMYALCVAQHVVSTNWIVESANAGYFLPPENFPITSKEFEADFQCDVQKVLHASSTRRTLFEGKIFYVTPGVVPHVNDVTRLIELCGGKVEKDRQSNAKIQEINSKIPNTYVIISCENDLHLVQHFTRASKHSYCNVCTTEYVLQSIAHQKIDIERHIIRKY